MSGEIRCSWVPANDEIMMEYHDREWGVPVHDDRKHFEMITLEGAQAGLSWRNILRRRENYRMAFGQFDPGKVAGYDDAKIEQLLENDGIIRNRKKVISTVTNAAAFLETADEYGSFDSYIWSFVGGKPIVAGRKSVEDIPSGTAESEMMSRDLKKRGFRFVGPSICYAYMQATGLVNDHTVSCFRFAELAGTA